MFTSISSNRKHISTNDTFELDVLLMQSDERKSIFTKNIFQKSLGLKELTVKFGRAFEAHIVSLLPKLTKLYELLKT